MKDAVYSKSEAEVKKQFKNYSKLNDEKFQEEKLDMKDYVTEMSLTNARTHFRLRSSTLPLKMNMRSQREFAEVMWRCDACYSSGTINDAKKESRIGTTICPETTSHIFWCPSYAPLRAGLSVDNDLDVVKYLQSVMRIREERDKKEQ